MLLLCMPFQVFLSLSFDEDLVMAKRIEDDQKFKNKKSKKRKNLVASIVEFRDSL